MIGAFGASKTIYTQAKGRQPVASLTSIKVNWPEGWPNEDPSIIKQLDVCIALFRFSNPIPEASGLYLHFIVASKCAGKAAFAAAGKIPCS